MVMTTTTTAAAAATSSPAGFVEASSCCAAFTKERLDQVVDAIKHALSDPELRKLSQRAVQGKIWHEQGHVIAQLLSELRNDEEIIRREILQHVSKLVYFFHEHGIDATLARAGLVSDTRIHAGSSLATTKEETKQKKLDLDIYSLDAKERLYMILQHYEWMPDFFRLYPLHFYENSFSFVNNIPQKELLVKVKVIGLGIAGSVCVSGLAKHGIVNVQGFEKRPEHGPSCVSSRYQNASWRAYDIAGKLVDDEALQTLLENRQQINVQYDNGTSGIVISDRVQIILGSAIQCAIQSARRYGAKLHFGIGGADSSWNEYYCRNRRSGTNIPDDEDDNDDDDDSCDIVGLFCGAHTSEMYNDIDGGLLQNELNVLSWSPELDSACKMWLQIKVSDKTDSYCTRGGELGAETWHYTIESARSNVDELERVRANQDSLYQYNLKKIQRGMDIGDDSTKKQLDEKYQAQKEKLEAVIEVIKKKNSNDNGDDKDNKNRRQRFDYIFTNAPDNAYNQAKRQLCNEHVVLDGGYTVQVKIATNSVINAGPLLKKFQTKLLVCGGDACVPPNPLAAYGATLACEAAGSFVRLTVAIGHLNAILAGNEIMAQVMMDDEEEKKKHYDYDSEWIKTELNELKSLFTRHYQARARSENYFQWVQTLICNMYSLPAFYPPKNE